MSTRSYEEAIDTLNTLQTSYRVLEERRKAGIRVDENSNAEMRGWLSKIGYSPRDLDKLNIVHVAGTKGKGTTCAYVDSILSFYSKSHSLPRKTGLFTSPHLVSVRERIRINSTPISSSLFAKYFFEVWDMLESRKTSSNPGQTEKPVYFRYLTLMSFHVFLSEGVDAAVYEVGVGGEFDSTNIIEHPAVTGISSLGIDHVFALGATIDKIAWHKAGILKSGSPAYTVKQLPEAARVIRERAQEKGVTVQVLEINPILRGVKIMPNAKFQHTNASLAVALAGTALKRIDPTFSLIKDQLPKAFVDGLEQVLWRGRCEIKVEGNIHWYLDGAHTADSLEVAARWFGSETCNAPGPRVLIFNQQSRPEALDLLASLFAGLESQNLLRFTHVIFCTNVTYAQKEYKRDFVNHTYDPDAIAGLTVQKQFAEKWSSLDLKATIEVVPSIEEALDFVKALGTKEKQVQAFITGSLHLVGGALGILEGADVL